MNAPSQELMFFSMGKKLKIPTGRKVQRIKYRITKKEFELTKLGSRIQ